MAPSPSPRLLKALLFAPRLRSFASNCPSRTILPSPVRATPWQRLLRSFSAGRGGGDGDGGDSFDSFGKPPFAGRRESGGPGKDTGGGSPSKRNGEDDSGEPRLFGEGGLFGRPASQERSMDEWDEQQDEPSTWSSEKGYDYTDSATESRFMDLPYEARGGERGEEGYTDLMGAAGEPSDTQFTTEDYLSRTPGWEDVSPQGAGLQAPAYIGEWGPDGRLRKAGAPQPLLERDRDVRSPALGDVVSDAAFGDLIKSSGFTDDDIANLMAGFYEPVGLPHLDDYKFVDVEAERKQKRREMELAKMAEMAKRWVRKVDEQGFAHGVGRRKASRARVWIREGEGRIIINRKHHDMHFTFVHHRVEYLEPFVITDTLDV